MIGSLATQQNKELGCVYSIIFEAVYTQFSAAEPSALSGQNRLYIHPRLIV